ncbi:GerAB/ArcD/ProY family transporter [Paenibacillus tianjinensis]|uniref:GerAB/ArcD/ProY family transporter n=1 Tax=Paenibacillus tianjinensis TaxID=2810347 RepID=A0ABX7LD83_9BACL|nr:GerAB/ArcD/ProY family transporter [Paenibacillus tianjinensis]QSF46085.1 GerAB/ArcD/ProY family transporter [Paenibacillus tianjinensis]
MNTPRQITTLRAAAVISSTIIGVGILSFPRYMAVAGGSSAPFVAFCGIVISFISFWLLASLCRRFPREPLFVFSRRLLGRPLAFVFTLLIFLIFTLLSGLTVRQFGDVATTVLYKKTPIEATIFLMLLICQLSARRSIIKFSYIHFFYLPLIIGPTVLITLISMRNIDWLNLQPVLTMPSVSFWRGAREASYLFQSSFVIILLIPYMQKPKQAVRAGALAIAVAGLLYLLIVIASVGLFGSEETKLLIYPTLESARSAAVGEGFLERLDALFIVLWVISVYTTVYTTYYLAAVLLQNLCNFKDQRSTSTVLLPLVFISAMLPTNVFETYTWSLTLGNVSLMVLTGYAGLLWAMFLFRRIQKKGASG